MDMKPRIVAIDADPIRSGATLGVRCEEHNFELIWVATGKDDETKLAALVADGKRHQSERRCARPPTVLIDGRPR